MLIPQVLWILPYYKSYVGSCISIQNQFEHIECADILSIYNMNNQISKNIISQKDYPTHGVNLNTHSLFCIYLCARMPQ